MTNFAKLKAVAAVSAACAALFGASSAHAYVYAVSHLEIQNLNIAVLNQAGTAANPATVQGFTFNQDNNASINGVNSTSTAFCGGTVGAGNNNCNTSSPVLDAATVNAPASSLLRTSNNFAFLGADAVNSYSGADSVINSAALVQGIPTSIEQIAESLLNTNGSAQAGSEQQSNTALTTTLVIGESSSSFSLSFLADADQRAEVNGSPGLYLSQSNMNVSFTLTNSFGGSISWAPRGTGAINDCFSTIAGATCVETADSNSLNFNASPAGNPRIVDNSYDTASVLSSFGIFIQGLAADTYTLALNARTSTSLLRNVPEPDALALVGIALAGLAFTAKRRNSKQA